MSEEKQDKIILPKQLQINMLEFFLRTSIPRLAKLEREKQQKAECSLSETSDKE